nr:hypothetical protein KPHV_79450 [Kitasatospora purpeofusca]
MILLALVGAIPLCKDMAFRPQAAAPAGEGPPPTPLSMSVSLGPPGPRNGTVSRSAARVRLCGRRRGGCRVKDPATEPAVTPVNALRVTPRPGPAEWWGRAGG